MDDIYHISRYNALRRSRQYLPKWESLSVKLKKRWIKQINSIEKLEYKIAVIENQSAGFIYWMWNKGK